jgi:hypothetical protein
MGSTWLQGWTSYERLGGPRVVEVPDPVYWAGSWADGARRGGGDGVGEDLAATAVVEGGFGDEGGGCGGDVRRGGWRGGELRFRDCATDGDVAGVSGGKVGVGEQMEGRRERILEEEPSAARRRTSKGVKELIEFQYVYVKVFHLKNFKISESAL